MTDERLYGLPDADEMHDSIRVVMDVYEADYSGKTNTPHEVTIEEWTVRHPKNLMPNADWLVEQIVESAGDNTGNHEGYEAHRDAAIRANAEELIDAVLTKIAAAVHWRQADEKVGLTVWLVTVNDAGIAKWEVKW